MGAHYRHAARKPASWGRLTALATAGVASTAAALTVTYVAVTDSGGVRAALRSWTDAARLGASARSAARLAAATGQRLSPAATSAATVPSLGSLALTARDYSMCPPAASACVDLTRHLTWLQSDGKVTFGPVQMEPGPPGTVHATPAGTFSVSWKGGPNVVSNTYDEPMPWAVFFGPEGIAFHAGSLTTPSHGCVHLTMANAHYYNEHLAVGAEVVVF
jgi:hypothetical protein